MRWALGGPATFRGPKLLTGGPPRPERAHGALALPASGCTARRPGVLGRTAGRLQVCARTNFLGQDAGIAGCGLVLCVWARCVRREFSWPLASLLLGRARR